METDGNTLQVKQYLLRPIGLFQITDITNQNNQVIFVFGN